MTAPTRETDATHDLSGTYVLTAQNLTMTLVLRQDAQGALSGTLSSTSGAQAQVDGREQAKAERPLVSNGVVRQVALSGRSGRPFKLERRVRKNA